MNLSVRIILLTDFVNTVTFQKPQLYKQLDWGAKQDALPYSYDSIITSQEELCWCTQWYHIHINEDGGYRDEVCAE